MTTLAVSKKIQKIELELEVLKRSMKPDLDFEVDERNWNKIEGDLRKSRKSVYQKSYGKA